MLQFIIQEQSWYKRKNGRKFEKQEITKVTVEGFQKVENHQCIIKAVIDNESLTLSARVFSSETYRHGPDGKLEKLHHGWKVQGIDENGHSIILKLVE